MRIIDRLSAIAWRIALSVWIVLGQIGPAPAQYADLGTWGGTSSGTNTITLTIPNYDRNAAGVPIRFLPANANTSSATLNINGVGALSIYLKTPTGLQALVGGELNPNRIATVIDDGTYFELEPSDTPTNATLGFGYAVNITPQASVAANALTLAFTGNNGIALGTTNPGFVPFRNASPAPSAGTAATILEIQAAQSFVIASGSTMGCVSGQMCRIWYGEMDSSGSPVLWAYNALNGTSILPINETASQTCQSGTSGGNSPQLFYCNTPGASGPIRILGYVEIQESAAGTYVSNPSLIQPFGPGIRKPGDPFPLVSGSLITTATSIPNTSTFTQSAVTVSITPSSAANVVQVLCNVSVGETSTQNPDIVTQVSRGTSPTLIGFPAMSNVVIGGSWALNAIVGGADTPNTNSSQPYYVYAKANAANGYVNPAISLAVGSSCTAQEIMSALDRPANDNGSDELRLAA
jgi:hypothetical protein